MGQSQAKAVAWLGLMAAFGKKIKMNYTYIIQNPTVQLVLKGLDPFCPPCNLTNVLCTSID